MLPKPARVFVFVHEIDRDLLPLEAKNRLKTMATGNEIEAFTVVHAANGEGCLKTKIFDRSVVVTSPWLI